MKILIITPDYPHNREERFPFVKQIVDEFAKQGNECCVLSPYSITRNRHFYKTSEESVETGVVMVRPNYLSLGLINVLGFSPSMYFSRKAYQRGIRKLPFIPDVIYCHFWESAFKVYDYARSNSIPIIVATGESEIKLTSPIPEGFVEYISGVVCVSSKNMKESIDLGLTTQSKCIVLPNAVNSNIFKRLDKDVCRKQLNVPSDAFVVAFVGWFNERKGVKRLGQAIKIAPGAPIHSFFIGSGDLFPECDNILYMGSLKHDEIPLYLNASDVFVLPTLKEGCCNAVVEAMSCGLPVISSNLPFNWDVLNEGNSILVSPNDINEISDAIVELRDNKEKRKLLESNALRSAKSLSIAERASRILEFMKQSV